MTCSLRSYQSRNQNNNDNDNGDDIDNDDNDTGSYYVGNYEDDNNDVHDDNTIYPNSAHRIFSQT